MGFLDRAINKPITQGRIKPKEYHVQLPAPFVIRGQVAAAQLIRACAFAIASETFNAAVDHPALAFLGVGMAVDKAFTVEFSELNYDTWQVAFGMGGSRVRFSTMGCDWVVNFRVTEDFSAIVATTSRVRLSRKSGEQIRKAHYLAFIDFAQSVICASRPPSPALELAATMEGLGADTLQISPIADGTRNIHRCWTTHLTMDAISSFVELLPLASVSNGKGEWQLKLSLQSEEASQYGRLTVYDARSLRRIEYSGNWVECGSVLHTAIVAARGFGVGVLIDRILRQLDPDAQEEDQRV